MTMSNVTIFIELIGWLISWSSLVHSLTFYINFIMFDMKYNVRWFNWTHQLTGWLMDLAWLVDWLISWWLSWSMDRLHSWSIILNQLQWGSDWALTKITKFESRCHIVNSNKYHNQLLTDTVILYAFVWRMLSLVSFLSKAVTLTASTVVSMSVQ